VPGATYDYYINVTSPQWSSVAARKALRESINVNSALTTLYFGNYPRAWSVLSPTTEGYDKSLVNSWSYSPSKAEAAFKALGYTKGSDGYLQKNGKDLTLNMVNQAPDMDKRVELDTIVQQQLKQVGVKMLTSALEFTQYAAVTQGDKYDMESFSITTGSPSVLDTIFNSKNQPNAKQFLYNVAHYVSPQMNKWGAEAAAATTPAAADAIYRKMQQNVVDNAVVIPLYVETETFAAQSSLKGVQFDALGYPEFYGASDH
jgi:peptide/nickel transport system substrate-binding protein